MLCLCNRHFADSFDRHFLPVWQIPDSLQSTSSIRKALISTVQCGQGSLTVAVRRAQTGEWPWKSRLRPGQGIQATTLMVSIVTGAGMQNSLATIVPTNTARQRAVPKRFSCLFRLLSRQDCSVGTGGVSLPPKLCSGAKLSSALCAIINHSDRPMANSPATHLPAAAALQLSPVEIGTILGGPAAADAMVHPGLGEI
jgi:hypothetical protein